MFSPGQRRPGAGAAARSSGSESPRRWMSDTPCWQDGGTRPRSSLSNSSTKRRSDSNPLGEEEIGPMDGENGVDMIMLSIGEPTSCTSLAEVPRFYESGNEQRVHSFLETVQVAVLRKKRRIHPYSV